MNASHGSNGNASNGDHHDMTNNIVAASSSALFSALGKTGQCPEFHHSYSLFY
jgi:hypothetical protein